MAAYQRLALERHPDVASAVGDDFIRLHDAYAMLSDLDARARNDRDVVTQAYAQPPASRSSPHGFWGRPRRTWETDQWW
jgi:DnaJ-class molecular chaperone